ncbi:MAG: tRNA(Glu)-specific nuclease WapA precursor, partial [Verrucomicrobiota bacterium]
QTLTYARISGPTGLTVSAGGVVNWTPDETFGGTTNVVLVRVTDSGDPELSATNTFRVIVLEVNSTPVFAAVTNRTVVTGVLLSINLPATDSDLPAQTLTRALVSGPAGIVVSPAGLLTWTPTVGQAGTTNLVRVRVTDNGVPALSVTNSFTLIVRLPAPIPPSAPKIAAGNEVPQLVVKSVGTDGTTELEITAASGEQWLLESSTTASSWTEVSVVTGQGPLSPVKVSVASSEKDSIRFWRLSRP